MKIGRNEPCRCGSGKKYKKCHMDKIDKDKIPEEVLLHFQKVEQKRRELISKGIYINYVNPVLFNDRKVWALGSKIYSKGNPNETFHDFIQFILTETLGFKWISEQKLLQEDQQHFLSKCFNQADLFRDKLVKENTGNLKVIASTPKWLGEVLDYSCL